MPLCARGLFLNPLLSDSSKKLVGKKKLLSRSCRKKLEADVKGLSCGCLSLEEQTL